MLGAPRPQDDVEQRALSDTAGGQWRWQVFRRSHDCVEGVVSRRRGGRGRGCDAGQISGDKMLHLRHVSATSEDTQYAVVNTTKTPKSMNTDRGTTHKERETLRGVRHL